MNVTAQQTEIFRRESELCRKAQRSWSALPVSARLRFVRALRPLLAEHCDELADSVKQDIGKQIEESLSGEVLPLAAACKFLMQSANGLLKRRRIPMSRRPIWLWGEVDYVYRRPRGLVGIIGTWNYPIILNGVQIVQALTAGNGVLWKPSELAATSAQVLHELLMQAGYPTDLIQVLPATREAGPQLANAEVDHVVFTGSSAVGRKLAEHLGRRLISSTMELSGCDAFFVLDDADVQMAAEAAWFAATLNHGQTCIASRRAFVQRKVYQPFIDAIAKLAANAGPMPTVLDSQSAQAARLAQDAVAAGARLLTPEFYQLGNGDAKSCRPTVVIDCRPEMAICREASFAPILAILPFDQESDALRMNANCTYELGSAVFTGTPARGISLSHQLHSGSVSINDVVISTAHPATPFGGGKESGWGSTQGAEGLLEMTVPQVVSVRGGKFRPHYAPANGKKGLTADFYRGILQFSHGAGVGKRIRGLWKMIRAAK